MKNLLKKLIPDRVLLWYKKWYKRKNPQSSKYEEMDTQEIFTEIYNKNHWRSSESISGPGSELIQTQALIDGLNDLIKKRNIKSVLDIPCGDFNWMQRADIQHIDYIGADIVQELIEDNRKRYSADNIRFEVLDVITDSLPQSDIIIVRDCLVHLSLEKIYNSIGNIKSSGSKYLLTTTFPEHTVNFDIQTGDWRPLNLQVKPFNFPEPLLVINEKCTELNGKFRDKSMALWEIDKIELPTVPYQE